MPLFFTVSESSKERFVSILRKWPNMPEGFMQMLESYANPRFWRAREVVRNLHNY